MCALSVGASAPNLDTRNFSRKVSWNFKSFAKIERCVRWEILWLTFLIRKVSWGFRPNPDTKDFSRKVLWNLKSFTKIKWCVRWEILLPTFLIRKVGQEFFFARLPDITFIKIYAATKTATAPPSTRYICPTPTLFPKK